MNILALSHESPGCLTPKVCGTLPLLKCIRHILFGGYI